VDRFLTTILKIAPADITKMMWIIVTALKPLSWLKPRDKQVLLTVHAHLICVCPLDQALAVERSVLRMTSR